MGEILTKIGRSSANLLMNWEEVSQREKVQTFVVQKSFELKTDQVSIQPL